MKAQFIILYSRIKFEQAIDITLNRLVLVSVSPQGQGVVLLPDVVTAGSGVVEQVTLVDTSGFLSS